jgi:hypothetical protein
MGMMAWLSLFDARYRDAGLAILNNPAAAARA